MGYSRQRLISVALPALAVLCVGTTLARTGAIARSTDDRGAPADSGWKLYWSDEFDVPGPPDPEYWSHEVNCAGGGNNERQCYTDRLDNAYVGDDGLLHIVAKEEFYSGPSLQDDQPGYPGPSVFRNYTSARLRTRDKVDWKYGRIEVRAQLAGGKGMWPAIWMLPTDWVYGGWPSSGEIDVVEGVNLPTDGFGGWGPVVHGTLHYGLRWPQWENHGGSYAMSENPADGLHEYAIEWEPDEIRWYVDGVHYQTQTSAGWYNYVWGGQSRGFVVATDRAPFDQRFHLLMNVAVGGDWPGPPDTGWDADREMLVDYVRVYQCPRADFEGRGEPCATTVDPAVEVLTDAGTPGIHEYLLYDGGAQTLTFEFGNPLDPTIIEGTLERRSFAAPGVTVDSEETASGAWEIEFRQSGLLAGEFLGRVSLGPADTSGVPGSVTGFRLFGGTGWSNNGELEFDIQVRSIDPEARLSVKMDGSHAQVGSVEIEVPAKGKRHRVALKLADLLANHGPGEAPLDVNDIRNVFVLESTGPARVLVDNIRLQCAFNTEPEWWQPDKNCGLLPRL